MDSQKLAELLFPHIDKTPRHYEEIYKRRALPGEARVTRLAPSPTGFIHLGNLYGALVDERLAHQSGGAFYLRIEDTDNKRAVEGAVDAIINSLRYFGVEFDEGATTDGEIGDYGPYRQRERAKIYQAFAKELVRRNLAYPCFCGEDELEAMRQAQSAQKVNFGYYGKWARHRDFSLDAIKAELDAKKPYVLRFRAPNPSGRAVETEDAIRGRLVMPENGQDIVLLKSDGIPTYHFAHVIDDHLMRTTHVVRGEEWLATLPIHLALFEALGFTPPIYCHTAQLMKLDGGAKRKLSKRKDPELSLDFYRKEGYLPLAVREYLMTVLNSNFEEWRAQNPGLLLEDFTFSTEKMSSSGALFDLDKLNDISKNIFAGFSSEEMFAFIAGWAKECDGEYYRLFTRDRDFALKILSIGRGGEKPRKDIVTLKQSKDYFAPFFDELFAIEADLPENIGKADAKEIIDRYLAVYNLSDTQEDWFAKLRAVAEEMGYAPQPKLYKKNPDAYKGHVGDVSNVIRVALTGRLVSPDLWAVSQALGERALKRLENYKNSL